jgi:hypothetical protein
MGLMTRLIHKRLPESQPCTKAITALYRKQLCKDIFPNKCLFNLGPMTPLLLILMAKALFQNVLRVHILPFKMFPPFILLEYIHSLLWHTYSYLRALMNPNKYNHL